MTVILFVSRLLNVTMTDDVSDAYCAVAQLGASDESPPPFLALVQDMDYFKSNILGGVNFASGGSGIFDQTGSQAFVNT